VLRDLLTAFLAIAVVSQAAALVIPPQSPASNNTSANATPVAAADPAAVVFTTGAGLVLHAIKPGSTAAYENAIVALQDALSKSTDPQIRAIAAGWRVYRVTELDAKANPLYVHLLQPATPGVDYRPSLWLDKLLAGAPAELIAKYRNAFAVPPSKLPLVEFAHMSVAPVGKPSNATPTRPGNTTAPKPPGDDADCGPSKGEVGACIKALIGLVQRAALQTEDTIVQTKTQRSREPDLGAATDVTDEVRLLPGDQALAIAAAASRGVHLNAPDFARRLQQDVARAGLQRGQSFERVFDGVGVLELEPDDEQPEAKRQPANGAALRRRGDPDKRCDVSRRLSRDRQQRHTKAQPQDSLPHTSKMPQHPRFAYLRPSTSSASV
jgi:hypothetical protein